MIMPTLLLVDEERIMAFDLVRRPTTLGSTVLATAGSGREAIQQAVDLRPDLVLMDVGFLGGMDGLEAAAHIRAQAAIPMMPRKDAAGRDSGPLGAASGHIKGSRGSNLVIIVCTPVGMSADRISPLVTPHI